MKSKYLYVTEKGLAALAAIEAGMIQQNDNGDYDTAVFELFWEKYQEKRRANASITRRPALLEQWLTRRLR